MATKSIMQLSSPLHVALSRPGPSWGAWQMIPGSNVSRTIVRCGYEWVLVDCEHGNIDDSAMHEAVAAIAACGASPIVRVPDNQGWMVKRALDAGAHGILVPLLYSAADAEKLVQSAKFPPLGQRGFGSPFSMEKFHPDLGQTDYLQQANDALLTIIQIETLPALQAIDAIAAVPHIDVLFIGPFDLGNNIGHPIIGGVMAPELLSAIDTILAAAEKAGKKTGIFCTNGEQAKGWAEKGIWMISVIADMAALPSMLMKSLSDAKGSKEEVKPLTGPYGK